MPVNTLLSLLGAFAHGISLACICSEHRKGLEYGDNNVFLLKRGTSCSSSSSRSSSSCLMFSFDKTSKSFFGAFVHAISPAPFACVLFSSAQIKNNLNKPTSRVRFLHPSRTQNLQSKSSLAFLLHRSAQRRTRVGCKRPIHVCSQRSTASGTRPIHVVRNDLRHRILYLGRSLLKKDLRNTCAGVKGI